VSSCDVVVVVVWPEIAVLFAVLHGVVVLVVLAGLEPGIVDVVSSSHGSVVATARQETPDLM